MEAYLDNSATTRVFPEAADIVMKTMTRDYGNPSSMHKKGFEAELYIKEAARQIADTLKARPSEIIFTSGATESNNTAIMGAANAGKRRGNKIITSTIEHASVYNVFGHLESEGFEVIYVPVDHYGRIDLEMLSNATDSGTILVSVMFVNNEMGGVNDVDAISRVVKEKNPSALFHVDAVQAYGKYRINPKRSGIDLLSASAHKFNGPKGVGFLYVKTGAKITPLLYGGGQQKDMRSGTLNVPGIAGMGAAARLSYEHLDEERERLYALRELFISLISELEGVTVNGAPDRMGAPHIVSASFEGIRGEVLLHALEDKGVYVSSGSACSSNHPALSGTLKGIGVKDELLDATLRFSFGAYTTEEEIRYAAQVLAELLPVLRKYRRR